MCCRNAKSTKTRIETEYGSCTNGNYCVGRNAKSTKTRIETGYRSDRGIPVKVAMRNPLKQGLKLLRSLRLSGFDQSRNAKSTKTRIETCQKRLLVLDTVSRNAKSTKTRIETQVQ